MERLEHCKHVYLTHFQLSTLTPPHTADGAHTNLKELIVEADAREGITPKGANLKTLHVGAQRLVDR